MPEVATDLTGLGASAAARAIAARTLSALELAQALVGRIEAREPGIHAWAEFDADRFLDEARACDRRKPRGPLHGVAIGIKDVIDTRDLATRHGSPIYRDNRPATDATCVARLREAGAIIAGKTVTTEFAFAHPGPTRHPLRPEHTPGGSSSGSAAAVAAGMVPAALGTQTGGSIIRPAAFCGVVGYKPAFGRIPTAGLKHLAPSFDTIGFLCRSLSDVPLLEAVLAGEPLREQGTAAPAPRLVVVIPPQWEVADEFMREHLRTAGVALAGAGAQVRELDLREAFALLNAHHRVVMAGEVAESMAYEWREHRTLLSAEMDGFISTGRSLAPEDTGAARRGIDAARARLAQLLAPAEVVLTLSTPGEAPRGLAGTGNAIFNRLWTLLGGPCLHLPSGAGPGGLPIGLQLVALPGATGALLEAASWIAPRLCAGSIESPHVN